MLNMMVLGVIMLLSRKFQIISKMPDSSKKSVKPIIGNIYINILNFNFNFYIKIDTQKIEKQVQKCTECGYRVDL